MNVQDFINQWSGRAADFDGAYGNQCVDLANFYIRDVIGAGRIYTPNTGGAADFWTVFTGPGTEAFRKIENTPDGVPQEGDLIIWAANVHGVTGPAGHIAIATNRCNVNEIYSFDQNYPTGSLPHVQHHPNYAGVYGWLRPLKFDAPAPAPVVVEAPIEAAPAPVVEPAPASAPEPDVAPVEAPAPESSVPVVDDVVPSETSTDQSNIEHVTIVVPVKENIMDSIKDKVISKKFWLAVISVAYFMINGHSDQAMAVVLAYLGVQGAIDHKNAG